MCVVRTALLVLASAIFILPARAAPGAAAAAGKYSQYPACSIARTNDTCILTIDRKYPVAPKTIQMYSGQQLIVEVVHPLPYERYFLDLGTGQAATIPDVYSSIAKSFVSPIGGLVLNGNTTIFKALMSSPAYRALKGIKGKGKPKALPKDVCTAVQTQATNAKTAADIVATVMPYTTCFQKLYREAANAYRAISPFLDTTSVTASGSLEAQSGDYTAAQSAIEQYVTQEIAVSDSITNIAPNAKAGQKKTQSARKAIAALDNEQKILDAITSDLLGYKQRFADLQKCADHPKTCKDLNLGTPGPIFLPSVPDQATPLNASMTTRTVTYTVDTLNMVSNSLESAINPANKNTLATISVVYAGTSGVSHYSALRWEASAGVLLSTLPIRSFSAVPVYSGSTVTSNVVREKAIYPTAVPFVAGNYKFENFHTRWPSAMYGTIGVGLNPNTKSADFMLGISFSWRDLMFGVLCHFAHDVSLTDGFHDHEQLPATFSQTVPTRTHWTEALAFGISVRVPPLTGR